MVPGIYMILGLSVATRAEKGRVEIQLYSVQVGYGICFSSLSTDHGLAMASVCHSRQTSKRTSSNPLYVYT